MPVLHHVIYIPGLADHTVRNLGQGLLISLWRRRYRIKADYHVVGWADKNGDFDKKLARLLAQIDHWSGKGHTVSLVGSSAGATMALHAFAKRRTALHRIVLIAPAIGQAKNVASEVFELNPAFETALKTLPAATKKLTDSDRVKVLCVKPQSDRVVKLSDMDLPGAHYTRLSTNGHLWTIVASLTVHATKIMRFIMRADSNK